jgi:hypothetical protein
MKMDYPGGGTRSFKEAMNTSKRLLDSKDTDAETRKMAQSLHDTTEKALAPFGRSRWYGFVGTTSAYDTNILLIPSTTSGSAETSGKATLKQSLILGGGYVSSALGFVQFAPSLRSSVNSNFNKDSQGSQFATNTLSVYVNRGPLDRTSYGLRLEGTLTFKNDVDPETKSGTFRSYSKGGVAGAYVRHELAKKVLASFEGSIQPTTYENDPDGDQHRGGTGYELKAGIANDRGDRWWNPSASVRYGSDGATGKEYSSTAIGGEVQNSMSLGPMTELTGVGSFSMQKYPKRPAGERKDTTLGASARLNWKWKPQWTVLGSLIYTRNGSNFDSQYSYSRMEFSGGVTYSF